VDAQRHFTPAAYTRNSVSFKAVLADAAPAYVAYDHSVNGTLLVAEVTAAALADHNTATILEAPVTE